MNNVKPFHFKFIEIINASSTINKEGHSRWRVDIMVQELLLHFSQRLILDFVVEITPGKHGAITCAEYTTFPFPRYFVGYPAMDQMIPLPTQVITTGMDVLSTKGVDCEYPMFKNLYLNKAWLENSDLALGTELSTCKSSGINDTLLPSSNFKKIKKSDIKLPEKEYADCIKNPANICYKGTETYNESTKEGWPSGWIQPAKWRNKWPRLWSEPRDRNDWPSTPVGNKWNNIGVRYPIPEPDKQHPGIRWSTEQPPRTPLYWPTITGLPQSGGPNFWLFNPYISSPQLF
jgi:hypothetical protein